MLEADLREAGLDPDAAHGRTSRPGPTRDAASGRAVGCMVTGGGGLPRAAGRAPASRPAERPRSSCPAAPTTTCGPRDGIERALARRPARGRHPPRRRRRRHRRQPREPRPLLLRERDHGHPAHGAGPPRGRREVRDRSARSAPIRSSRPVPVPRGRPLERLSRRRPTRRTAWPRRCCSSRARPTGQQYGFDAIHLIPVNLYGPGDNFDPAQLARHPGADQEVRRRARAGRRPHRGLGHGLRLARVPLRRRRGRGHRPRRRALRRRRAGQPRRRARDHDPRAGGADRAPHRLRGRDPLGRQQARRPAAAGARHQSRPGAVRLPGRRPPSRTACAGPSSGTRPSSPPTRRRSAATADGASRGRTTSRPRTVAAGARMGDAVRSGPFRARTLCRERPGPLMPQTASPRAEAQPSPAATLPGAAAEAPRPPCRFCGTPLEQTFVDLGMSPLCERFLARRPARRHGAVLPAPRAHLLGTACWCSCRPT